MKTTGYILIIFGIIFLGFASLADTAIYSDGSGRVSNLGLLFGQQNKIIVSCFVILYGVILITNSSHIEKPKPKIAKSGTYEVNDIGFKSPSLNKINNYRSYDFFKNKELNNKAVSDFSILCKSLVGEAKENHVSTEQIEIILDEIMNNITSGLDSNKACQLKSELQKSL